MTCSLLTNKAFCSFAEFNKESDLMRLIRGWVYEPEQTSFNFDSIFKNGKFEKFHFKVWITEIDEDCRLNENHFKKVICDGIY